MGGKKNCGIFTEGVLFKVLKQASQECRMKIVFKFLESEYEISFFLVLYFGNNQ